MCHRGLESQKPRGHRDLKEQISKSWLPFIVSTPSPVGCCFIFVLVVIYSDIQKSTENKTNIHVSTKIYYISILVLFAIIFNIFFGGEI